MVMENKKIVIEKSWKDIVKSVGTLYKIDTTIHSPSDIIPDSTNCVTDLSAPFPTFLGFPTF